MARLICDATENLKVARRPGVAVGGPVLEDRVGGAEHRLEDVWAT